MRVRGALGLIMVAAVWWPATANAHHRDQLMRRAIDMCGPKYMKQSRMDSDDVAYLVGCGLPHIREAALRSMVRENRSLDSAAYKFAADLSVCSFSDKPCGHKLSYYTRPSGYITHPYCDQVIESSQVFPAYTSPQKILSTFLHNSRSFRALARGKWLDYGAGANRYKRLFVTIMLGRPCLGYTEQPREYQPPPPINLQPPQQDDLVHEKNNGTFKYHVVYLWAKDRPSRFGLFREQINQAVIQASHLPLPLNEKQRTVRFDLGTADDPNAVDITGIQVPASYAELAKNPVVTISYAVDRSAWEWDRSNMGRHKNLLVFADVETGILGAGALGFPSAIGGAYTRDPLKNPWNNEFQWAVVFLQDKASFITTDLRAVRHEIGHNLGAVGGPAPHSFDGAHCNDAYEDEMCYDRWDDKDGNIHNTPRRLPKYAAKSNQGAFWDFGHDDYWDPVGGKLPWWTTNLSRFVCSDADCTPDGSDLIGFEAVPNASGA